MIKDIKLLLIASCICIFIGCDSPKLSSLGSNDVIVAFGDSLTVGVGTTTTNSYPSKLAELTGVTVINSGISGETTSRGLVRLPKVIKAHNPSLVILLEGGNDILQNVNYERIERNLDEMIRLILDSGAQVVLIGVPEKKLLSNSAPFYRDLAKKHDLVFDSSLIGGLMRTPSKKSDPIHFNEAGYAEMAEEIYTLLSKNGAFN